MPMVLRWRRGDEASSYLGNPIHLAIKVLRSCASTCLWLAAAGCPAWALLSEPGGSSRSTSPSLTHNSQRRGALHRGRLGLRFCPPSTPLIGFLGAFILDGLFLPVAMAGASFGAVCSRLPCRREPFYSRLAQITTCRVGDQESQRRRILNSVGSGN